MGKSNIKNIDFFLIDDQPVYNIGLRAIMKDDPNMTFLGEVLNGTDALLKIGKTSPDVIIIGFNKFHMKGFGDIVTVTKKFPEAKVLALSVNDNESFILEVIRLGAMGYVMKNAHPAEIIEAVISVNNSTPYYSPHISNFILKQHAFKIRGSKKTFISAKLTPRETDVLLNFVNGFSNRRIASILAISVRTVETHREHITQKLNIKTVAELTKYAISNGLTDV